MLAPIAFGVAVLATACGPDVGPPDSGTGTATRWADARALWYFDRDPAAYRAWTELDPSTPEGTEARALIAEAEPYYREGIAALERGEDDARVHFERAVRIAPMDPRLYLPLARAFRDLGRRSPENPHLFIRAAEYYRKFLVLLPHDRDAAAARAELAEIDPEASRLFGAPPETPAAPPPAAIAPPLATWPLWVALGAMMLALGAIVVLVVRSRRASVSLETLIAQRPELHPAIAYLISSLRHEFLKHRIGAVGDALDALGAERATSEQRSFLVGRLFGGEPLERAWAGHVIAFERALGPELDLRAKDRHFEGATKSVRAIAKLEPSLQRGEAAAARALRSSHDTLRSFDAHLGAMARELTRTSVDGAMFRDVVEAVRSEYAAGSVALDEVAIRAPEPAPKVEVFRVDLVLVLKNVVRNAILAVGGSEPPRRIALEVETELEPTGEERVRVIVRDTSEQTLTTEDIYARRIDRGLGLVTAALGRYDGTIAVEPGREGWAKSVVISFFRAE